MEISCHLFCLTHPGGTLQSWFNGSAMFFEITVRFAGIRNLSPLGVRVDGFHRRSLQPSAGRQRNSTFSNSPQNNLRKASGVLATLFSFGWRMKIILSFDGGHRQSSELMNRIPLSQSMWSEGNASRRRPDGRASTIWSTSLVPKSSDPYPKRCLRANQFVVVFIALGPTPILKFAQGT